MTVENKTCSVCSKILPIDDFAKQKTSPDGLRYDCRDCQRAYMAKWRAEHRQYFRDASAKRWQNMSEEEKERKRRLDLERYHKDPGIARDKLMRRKYGIGQAEYDAMLLAQGGVCAICGDDPAGRTLHVDHHHGTGSVRGLLCTRCNTGLGQFRDNPDFLSQAISYLVNN